MRITTKSSERYAPDWEGNLDLPKDERLYITIEFPDCETREGLRSIESRARFLKDKEQEDEREERDIIINTTFDVARIFADYVPKVEGFDETVDGKARKVTTGTLLLKSKHPKLPDLRDKIVARVMGDDVTEDEAKNSESLST